MSTQEPPRVWSIVLTLPAGSPLARPDDHIHHVDGTTRARFSCDELRWALIAGLAHLKTDAGILRGRVDTGERYLEEHPGNERAVALWLQLLAQEDELDQRITELTEALCAGGSTALKA